MGKIRRRFDLQFKSQVVQAIQSGASTLREICQEHQLHHQTVERWVEKYSDGTLIAKQSLRERVLEKQVEKLRAKVGDLVMQIDFLKKFHEEVRQRRSVDSSVITLKNLAQFQKGARP